MAERGTGFPALEIRDWRLILTGHRLVCVQETTLRFSLEVSFLQWFPADLRQSLDFHVRARTLLGLSVDEVVMVMAWIQSNLAVAMFLTYIQAIDPQR